MISIAVVVLLVSLGLAYWGYTYVQGLKEENNTLIEKQNDAKSVPESDKEIQPITPSAVNEEIDQIVEDIDSEMVDLDFEDFDAEVEFGY